MGKLQDFLMGSEAFGEIQTEVMVKGFDFPFVIRSISEGENKQLRKSCQRTTIDRRTKQKTVETDTDLYNNRLVIACCVDPNFKDAKLQEKFKVMGAEALIDKILKPGQFIDLLLAVQDINGYGEDINDLVDEAKN